MATLIPLVPGAIVIVAICEVPMVPVLPPFEVVITLPRLLMNETITVPPAAVPDPESGWGVVWGEIESVWGFCWLVCVLPEPGAEAALLEPRLFEALALTSGVTAGGSE